jgi:hypothetical protein
MEGRTKCTLATDLIDSDERSARRVIITCDRKDILIIAARGSDLQDGSVRENLR